MRVVILGVSIEKELTNYVLCLTSTKYLSGSFRFAFALYKCVILCSVHCFIYFDLFLLMNTSCPIKAYIDPNFHKEFMNFSAFTK